MPEDVGGTPSPDGAEPDDNRDRGGADEEFASVVFDEDFIRSAEFHEPSAVERLLAAAEARAEAEHRRGRTRRDGRTGTPDDTGHDPYDRDAYGNGRCAHGHDAYGRDSYGHHDPDDHDTYGPHGSGATCEACAAELMEEQGGRRARGRWHRPVAWMLAVVMGVGMVALAFAAVYRGSSPHRQDPAPLPATTGVGARPSASADYSAPPVPAQPRIP